MSNMKVKYDLYYGNKHLGTTEVDFYTYIYMQGFKPKQDKSKWKSFKNKLKYVLGME